jgi:hypothetical protein
MTRKRKEEDKPLQNMKERDEVDLILGQANSQELEKKVKKYFKEKIETSQRWKTIYRDRLLPDDKYWDTEVWHRITKEHPEKAAPFLAFIALTEVYELLEIMTEGIIDTERGIERVQKDVEIIAKKSNVDLSNLEKDVGELKAVILPKLKGIAELIDREKLDDERIKKNGDEMIV